MYLTDKKPLKLILEFLMCAIGSVIAAFAIECFLVPNTILDGGVIGIGIIISNLSGFSLGILTIILNLPFLFIGWRRLGLFFTIKAGFSMALFSVFVSIFGSVEPITTEPLLAVCFGGVLLGIGVGLVIRGGGCLDGTETVAILLNRKFKWPVGTIVLVFNIVIYAVAGIIFGWDRAMYSLLTYFITSRILDLVESGMEQVKAAMIITTDAEEVAEKIYSRLGRTVTIMEGEGLVNGKNAVLYCVLTRFEIYELKKIVHELDHSAFVTITDVNEIIGNHIKNNSAL